MPRDPKLQRKKEPYKPTKGKGEKSADEFLRDAKKSMVLEKVDYAYREISLRIHGHVCARCGREFDGKNLRELTVHHKDFNHDNNPPDGSNWENLCIYCHEDVHADHLKHIQSDPTASRTSTKEKGEVVLDTSQESKPLTLADMLKQAMEKKK